MPDLTPDEAADPYPPRDGFDYAYGRRYWTFEDVELCVVEGHDRRAYAAASAYIKHYLGHGDKPGITKRWMTWTGQCGCTEEQHAEHIAGSKAAGLDWVDCAVTCSTPTLPPCGGDYQWVATTLTAEPKPGAVPVLEVE